VRGQSRGGGGEHGGDDEGSIFMPAEVAGEPFSFFAAGNELFLREPMVPPGVPAFSR